MKIEHWEVSVWLRGLHIRCDTTQQFPGTSAVELLLSLNNLEQIIEEGGGKITWGVAT